MPVECNVELRQVGQERFHVLDRIVMRHAFDIHNALGRFCDERIYQDELAQRCRDSGLVAHREAQLRVTHAGFVKCYYLDLLIEHGVIDELKAVQALASNHDSQLINYLLLAGLNHGKLVNFRSGSVESRFVSTRLCREDRLTFHLIETAWDGNDDASRLLRNTCCALLSDWGTCLDAGLYRDALLHFLARPGAGIQPVEVQIAGRIVGTQNMCLLDAGTAWHLSTIRRGLKSYETHIVRLLNHTCLERIHWINLNQQEIALKTLKK